MRRLTILLISIALLLPAAATQAAAGQQLLGDERNTIEVFQRYGPSVVAVNVTVRGRQVDPFEGVPEEMVPPWFRDSFRGQPEERPRQGSGSGFVIDSDEGLIVTNYHVVRSALSEGTTDLLPQATVEVVFPNREPLPVRVVGANALYDLALLQPEESAAIPDDALPIPLANSDELLVGQKTIAIGNPFGLQSTLTTGIVSALGRDLPGVGQIAIPMVQTDAAINPGNSGGPLLNSRGEIIGVNAAILPGLGVGGTRGFIGVGFAIPVNLLRESLDELIAGGLTDLASRARLGVSVIDLAGYPPEVRRGLRLPEHGVMIIAAEKGSPAREAGLRGASFQIEAAGRTLPAGGDVIVALDGTVITETMALQRMVFARRAGDVLTLTIVRDGETLEVEIGLREIQRTPDAE